MKKVALTLRARVARVKSWSPSLRRSLRRGILRPVLLGLTPPLEPTHDSVPVVVERQGERRHDHGEDDELDVVASRGLRALRGEHPRPGNSPEGRHHREDPE